MLTERELINWIVDREWRKWKTSDVYPAHRDRSNNDYNDDKRIYTVRQKDGTWILDYRVTYKQNDICR